MNHLRAILIMAVFALASLLVSAPANAQSGNQWVANYFPNLDWTGQPIYTEYPNIINYNWGTNSPGPGMPNQNWTARFTSTAFFYAGVYRFTVLAADEFAFYVHGALIGDTRNAGQSGKTFVYDVSMLQSNANIQLDFRQYSGTAYVMLTWQYIKEAAPTPAPPPPSQPTGPWGPGSASSVQTQYGDYTPCIQQVLHQSKCFQSSGQWDSPNLGSIETEPQIIVWGNCKADEVQTMQLYYDQDPQPAKCSKTEAGWFPN